MHIAYMGDRLLQVRVPEELAHWIELRAELEGDSLAGWVRRWLLRESRRAQVEAWAWDADDPRDPVSFQHNPTLAPFILERVADLPDGAVRFVLRHGPARGQHAGSTMSRNYFVQRLNSEQFDQWRFVLEGSSVFWLPRMSWFNGRARRMEIVLAPERHADEEGP